MSRLQGHNCTPVDLKRLALALGGDVVGQQVLCPGPGHSAQDRSLAVRPAPDSPLGFIIYSHAGDSWRDCLEYVLERLGCPKWQPKPDRKPSGNRTTVLWKQVWREAEPLNHLALGYLGSRGINEPHGAPFRFKDLRHLFFCPEGECLQFCRASACISAVPLMLASR
jgi:hypothetical protein